MKGISWRRTQGLTDSLLIKMLDEHGLDNVPQWTKKDGVRMQANARWMALAKDRDGPVNPNPRKIDDPAAVTAEIAAKAKELGADLVGSCELTPIMIIDEFDMPHRSVISMVIKEDYANVLKGSRAIEAETYDVYVRCAEISTELAAFVRDMGYPAWAHHNGASEIMAIPTMIQCGFGELGRHGSLINPDLSANFRPAFVTTDIPLAYDSPVEFGVQDYCESCNLCRNNCPGEAIATDHIVTEGVKRWLIDMEKCYPYSRLNEAYCHICVDVCPYIHKENKKPENQQMFKAYMKIRKEDGYRSPNRI